jgi:hypothetical protein
MVRRVLYDADSTTAAAAARLLADELDVEAWGDADPAAGVVLTSAPGFPEVGDHARVIGVVDANAPGPWPTSWYGLLPAERARLQRELSELNAIGIRLSAERDLDVLLETILTKARQITRSDAGSLYLIEEALDGSRRLRFALAHNASVEITFQAVTLPLDSASVAGHVALTGEVVNLADAYNPPPGSPFQINRWFDDNAGYRTMSMLVVPMRTPQGDTLGALHSSTADRSSTGRCARRPRCSGTCGRTTRAMCGWPGRWPRRRPWR